MREGGDGVRIAAMLRHVMLLALATAGAVLAQTTDHPVTAALCFMLAVLVNGATAGLGVGLASAAVACVIYNVFVRFPVYELGLSSIDDVVPLIAFNITAAVSGWLAGRLQDRAQVAERAWARLDRLLDFSQRLQQAETLPQIADVVAATVPPGASREAILPAVATIVPGLAAIDDRDVATYAGMVAVAVERSAQAERRAEAVAARQSEDFKMTLMASLSHDLRTPIAAIAAAADSLARYSSILDAEARDEMVATIRDQSARLASFTAKLLSMARIQGGIAARDLEVADVGEILGGAIRQARAAHPGRAIERAVDAALVRVNPAMLEQALFNLIDNALKHGGTQAPVEIVVGRDAGRVTVAVRDRGRGIAADELASVFDRFRRGDARAPVGGHGLGLSITKGFVEAFGGSVRAVSPRPDGPGTEMILTLPEAAVELAA